VDYLPRIADESLTRALSAFPVVIVEGARATGKTTSAARVAATTFRFPRDLALVESDPTAVLSTAERPVLIDEWQLAGVDLLWALKTMVDEDPRPGSFLLVGSVEPESYGPTFPLTGRGTRLTLRPMSRRELTGKGNDEPWLARLTDGELTRARRDHPPMGAEEVATTGFPAAARSSHGGDWLRAYAATVAERSIDERRDPVRVERLMRVLAESEAQAVPDEHLWRTADINRQTLTSYRDMLTRAHLRADLPAWASNRLKRLTMYPKLMHVDAALALAVARIGEQELAHDPALLGRYLESFVAAQLRPECDRLGAHMHHLRTMGGEREIDLLIEVDGKLIAIEVKAGVNPKPSDARHLIWLGAQLGDRLAASVVLHRGQASFELVDGVWALPISSMWA